MGVRTSYAPVPRPSSIAPHPTSRPRSSSTETYLTVEDADATATAVKEAGGQVAFEPIDIPPGRFAILSDPSGAGFAVIALSEESRELAP